MSDTEDRREWKVKGTCLTNGTARWEVDQAPPMRSGGIEGVNLVPKSRAEKAEAKCVELEARLGMLPEQRAAAEFHALAARNGHRCVHLGSLNGGSWRLDCPCGWSGERERVEDVEARVEYVLSAEDHPGMQQPLVGRLAREHVAPVLHQRS